jgi:hypothetical protein
MHFIYYYNILYANRDKLLTKEFVSIYKHLWRKYDLRAWDVIAADI